MNRTHFFSVAAVFAATCFFSFGCGRSLKDGEYSLTILSTNDVHGAWFDSTYVDGRVRKSLFALNTVIDSVRTADGASNLLLLDAGDCLQGDNAAYYFNYVDTLSPHLWPRLMEYMGYDAVAVGNHDIETGHPVYDRIAADLQRRGIPFLGGNAVKVADGKPYSPLYKIFDKAGLRIAVIGYTNANIKGWLTEEIWRGMDFKSIVDEIQDDVDKVRAKEKPDVVVALMHTATGKGDGSISESEALDVINAVRGVDWVLCGHDHRPYVEARDSCALLNSGSHARFVAEGKMKLSVRGGKIVSKTYEASLLPVRAGAVDTAMRSHFRKEYLAVKEFTLKEVGVLNVDLLTRDAYIGPCPYMDLIHTICLRCAPAEISFAAPLTYNGSVESGILRYNDLFTIYPFENQLFIVKLTGGEIRRYLEASYDRWIQTVKGPGETLLRIKAGDDPRTGQKRWSFENRSYNFDSAAGICYAVDVTKPFGERVTISSMASGAPFSEEKEYNVAMTSYRASGGGHLLEEAGVEGSTVQERTVERYPEIRNLLYDYVMENGSIDPEVIGNPDIIGKWSFVPEKICTPALKRDWSRLFGK